MAQYENTSESCSTPSEACKHDHRNSNAGESSNQRPITTPEVYNSSEKSHPPTKSEDYQPQSSTRRINQHKFSSLKKKSTGPSRHETSPSRLNRYGRLLTVPKAFGGRRIPRLPRCIWSLLSKPLTPPTVPVISVTSPEGAVTYPFVHNYYGNSDSEDSEDRSSSDEWGDTDTSAVDAEEKEVSCCS
ncbi:hypothetical protein F5B19DRAFT_415187 [Rostrohypoxylon terebratum]|nr:hypothetical protein F5B19DRAFT_415187 [Rostrohypoxylon terebratum]